MDNYRDLYNRAAKIFQEVKAVLVDPKSTPEQRAATEQMLVEARELRERAARLKEIESSMGEVVAEVEAKQGGDEAKSARRDKRQFKDWSEFLESAYYSMKAGKLVDERLQTFRDEPVEGHEKKDLVESVGASGGFLVPTEFMAELQAVMAEESIVWKRCTAIRMRRRQIDIPVLSQTATTAGVPHWFGGILFYYGDEGNEKTESDPSFRKLTLVAHKLYGYTRVSDELVEDSAISLGDFFSGPLGFAGGAAWYRDYMVLRGTGAGQPLGILNAGATITVARQSVASPIQYLDLVNMLESFLPSGRGIWLFSQSAMSNLLTLQDANGNYIWLPNMQNVGGSVQNTLFGLPVYFTEKLPQVGSAGDVVLADFRYYLAGDRQAATIETTKFDRWRYDQTSWRMVDRHGGQPWLSAPLTYEDGTTQVSPFVILGAKST